MDHLGMYGPSRHFWTVQAYMAHLIIQGPSGHVWPIKACVVQPGMCDPSAYPGMYDPWRYVRSI